jgi:succinate dehydrogenase/fumarate reductase flavoprotein subunit
MPNSEAPVGGKTDRVVDVVVIGSGAGGLSTAITAKKNGLDVVVLEKEPVFGGTTAFSGGVLWIPGNHLAKAAGHRDSKDAARTYIKGEAGNGFDEEAVEAFLDAGPEMLSFFERETAVKCVLSLYPDYHPDAEGGVEIGRSVTAAPFDISVLGRDMARLRPPLESITFMGMMFNSSNAELKHFFNATKSLTSFLYVARRLTLHFLDVLRHGKGVKVTSGNALAARLAKSALDLGIEIRTETTVQSLSHDGAGAVSGVVLADGTRIAARRGVVLACGGFSHDKARLATFYPHLRRGGEHLSPVPSANTGDGLALAEAEGAKVEPRFVSASAWMPTSAIPRPASKGGPLAFPHLVDRYKPGVIAVAPNGRRFVNESLSYHDVGEAMITACEGETATEAWLICDHATIRKYGLGFVKPAPVPMGSYLKSGYLRKGASLADLAREIGVDAKALTETVTAFNGPAARGEDPAFHRGSTAFNRYLGDPLHKPNPCVAPIQKAPFYAVRMVLGDLGTFDGLRTTIQGQVLRGDGTAVPGLFAVGNDRASIMGGAYPGAGITLGPIMTFGYITGRHLAGS